MYSNRRQTKSTPRYYLIKPHINIANWLHSLLQKTTGQNLKKPDIESRPAQRQTTTFYYIGSQYRLVKTWHSKPISTAAHVVKCCYLNANYSTQEPNKTLYSKQTSTAENYCFLLHWQTVPTCQNLTFKHDRTWDFSVLLASPKPNKT